MKKAATIAAVLACALAFLLPTPQFRFRQPQHCLLPFVSIAPTADPFAKCDIKCQMTGHVVPAAGRFDGFWDRNLKAWDLAVASSGRIHQAMLDAMRG